MATQDDLKRIAAEKAVEFVPENEYIGIGTGSTINFFIEALGKSGKKIKGAVSTSKKSSELLAQYGIEEVSLNDVNGLAVYIDGADEVNHVLQMIKGGGGAHLNEKIVASASEKFICIADESKYVSRLGKFPLPVEVIPHARSLVSRKLLAMGGQPELRVGFTTFNGNQIVDVHNLKIDQPVSMEDTINRIVGVVENGIFGHDAADVLILGTAQGAKVILPGQE
ncbi:ribose-5-phosphate isomerase RpiA [Neisseria sp. ZJ106]|uniref:Ribose-5-phosphate isomerase A n=1 Tax=Neisseria lisongii TaxID=2912188 RepID=A0AAW5AQC9_9NEIS|nr:ribose-5-phosphate isomerase RpiA [Neisseria lisongii]MCF7521703.1 ribose-5-phosphate isomerase RpiA [Neisseria lisongii]MCF7528755.1 ribose-5-phosphate isomerase RpiA [Neisseria lisongii]MCF7529613.1 ribose-5-phosphate isomerase RpiA [Neisseria lisongii]WCL72214.1 ribose-5-phosphate isomerase RpiA [Neisseria lisongii]